MNILFPIAEAHPLYKIGGLGDVGGALPPALNKLGVDIRLALPKHPEITLPSDYYQEAKFEIVYDARPLTITVYHTQLPNTTVPVYLFEENRYLSQHTDASDNHADKFAVFSKAVATWISEYSPYWQPQIVHCHDWHVALIPLLLKHMFHKTYKTIITIHNLAYQGITTTPIAQHIGLDPAACHILSWDNQDGDTNILLEGLLHADCITTVSPQYAKEILTNEYGEKINSILETKKTHISGILNGLDITFFNPATDPHLNTKYTANNWQQGKLHNRQDLYHQLQLQADPHNPLIAFVGRVDPYQKGIGLIIQAINEGSFPPQSTQFIFLGTGDPHLETELHAAAVNKSNITVITRFDEPLAHQIYAASHFCLIPSRFEPCGLVQLIAMRYGSLPIVRKTGGLADTVFEGHNGFIFTDYSHHAMTDAVHRAIDILNKPDQYSTMVSQAMKGDYSWRRSAIEYQQLYQELILGKRPITPHD